MQFRIWLTVILLAAGLAACASEVLPTPVPTPETELAEPFSVTVGLVSPTFTPSSTNTAEPTKTALPTPTATPIPSATHTPTIAAPLIQTTPVLPNLTWSENVEIAANVNGLSLEWSPVENEFVYNDCPRQSEPLTFPEKFVFLAVAPTFEDIDITPDGFSCFGINHLIWSPNGQEFFLFGFQDSQAIESFDHDSNVELWRMDKSGNNLTFTSLKGWFLNLEDWLDEETILYSIYSGGMVRYLFVYDLATNQEIANMWVLNPHVYATTSDYAVLEFGRPDIFNSVATYSRIPIHEKRGELDDLGPNSHALSFDGSTDYPNPTFFSSYSDWLPDEKQVLVETWDKEVNIIEVDTLHEKVMDLQLWDIETNTLELVAKGAFLGDFSPDGTSLAYVTANETGPEIQLLIRDTGEKLFSVPVYLEKTSWEILVSFSNFSPNGRYFTFFTPETDLVIYDLETGEMLPPLTAVPRTPLWSPDSTRFVYTDPVKGHTIYDTRSHTAYPLAETGGERLSNPQWSFDGTYLSVAYKIAEDEWQTAVLSLP